MKAKVCFNLDLSDMGDFPTPEAIEEFVRAGILAPARAFQIKKLHEFREDQDMNLDLKAIKMAEQLLRIKLTLLAESNVSIEALPDDYPTSTQLPFERKYEGEPEDA